MALIKLTRSTLISFAWKASDGAYLGGQLDETDLFIDDETGEEVGRRVRSGLPVEGALQAGMPLAELLGETEAQRFATMDAEKRRADAEKARADAAERRVRELEDELEARR